MKVRCVQITTPRSDLRRGPPGGITVGKVYKVAEVIEPAHTYALVNDEPFDRPTMYSIINDNFKIARYNQDRFEVVCDKPVQDLRTAFNWLTTELRSHIKYLESRDVF